MSATAQRIPFDKRHGRLVSDLENRLALLEQKMADNDRFYQQRYDFDQSALKVALQTSDHRLEVLNGHKQEMIADRALMMPRELATKMITDAQEKINLSRESMATRIDGQMRALETRVETIGRPNWLMLASSIGVITAVVSGLFIVIGLKIDAAVSPVTLEIAQIKTNAAAQESRLAERTANRERQINTLQARVAANDVEAGASTQAIAQFRAIQVVNSGRISMIEQGMAAGMSERKSAVASINGQMIELETQFKLVSTVINLMKDDTHQMISALWSKVDPKLRIEEKRYRPEMHERGNVGVNTR